MFRVPLYNKILTICLSILLVLSIAASCWVIIWYINLDDNFVGEIEIITDDPLADKAADFCAGLEIETTEKLLTTGFYRPYTSLLLCIGI